LIGLVEVENDGDECYYDTLLAGALASSTIENNRHLIFEHSDTDAGGLIITMSGWFNANVD